MTREEAIAEIQYYMNSDSYADAPSNEACKIAIEALALPQPSNGPLTMAELREMGGKPYWHIGLQKESPPPHWAILDPFFAQHIEDYRYGDRWIAYRRPPEREGVHHG